MKKTLYLLILLILLSCSQNEDNENNGTPSDFEVLVSSSSSTNVEINWSESFDPESKTVLYSVYLEGQEYASNLTLRSFNFDDLIFSTNYRGEIIASDPNGNKTIASFSFTTTENLPPNNFELISVESSNISLEVTWTEAIDPEGKEVVYELYINNQLKVSNLREKNYIFEELDAAITYSIKINAKDETGNITSIVFDKQTLDGIYHGDLSFRTQDSINSFGELGYIEITGNLEMDGLAVFADINDLSPINKVKKVRGYIIINFMNSLTSLSGLGIEHVGLGIRISRNDNLTNLNGLNNLVEVFGGLEIIQNYKLLNISGINNLITIGNSLSINNNINLTDINGFNSLTSADRIKIHSNRSLTRMNAFNNLTELSEDLSIYDNTALAIMDSFTKIETVNTILIKNTLIENLDILSSLSLVNGTLDIGQNLYLNDILGLSSLKVIKYGSLSIGGNPLLTNLSGLDNLDQIGYSVYISGNISLSNFCALQNVMQNFNPASLPSLYGNLFNPSLTDIANGNCSN
jgi:hypothetical protein